MTFSLSIWQKPGTEEVRIYIGGTTRQRIYFKMSSRGKVVWSSQANDTPHKFQTGQHYSKIRKDGDAANDVASAYGVPLGDKSSAADWERLMKLAADGIQISSDDEDADK